MPLRYSTCCVSYQTVLIYIAEPGAYCCFSVPKSNLANTVELHAYVHAVNGRLV